MWPETLYTGGVAILVGFGLVVFCATRSRNGTSDNGASNRRTVQPLMLILAAILIGIGILSVIRYVGRIESSPEIHGTNANSEYTNPHFGFSLRYGDAWRALTRDELDRASSKSARRSEIGSVLLALAREPAPGEVVGAGLMIGAEKLPESTTVRTGGQYFDEMMQSLAKRPDRPSEVKRESAAVIAGMTFDGLSLKRPWGNDWIGMRFWATVKGGYVLLLTGSYSSPDGRQEVEVLIQKIERFPEK